MATPTGSVAGNQQQTSFFTNATQNRLALVPAASQLAKWANKPRDQGAIARMNSLVIASQVNGAGPAIVPSAAPFSFTSFATGIRNIKMAMKNGIKKKTS
jgi:hypothetical protein